jgi:SPFH domain / Band 7 family
MSPDGNRPDIPRQRPDAANWDQSLEHGRQVDHDALPPLPDPGDEEVFASSQLAPQQDMGDWDSESNQTGPFEADSSSPFDFLKEPGRYVPIIVVPLLFAVLTGLVVFFALNSHRSSISTAGFLPTIIVIIAVAVAQGAVISYIDADNGMWLLATAGGFCLFFLIAIFALFGPVAALIVFCVLAALFVVVMRLYFHPVVEGYVDIVYAFGKYSRTLFAGPNVLLPWEKVAHSLNIGEKQWVCLLQKVQLSRDEDVVLRATISYQLMPKDAYIAVTHANQWEEMLKELVVSTIQSIATTFTPDDFIAWPQGLHSRPLTYDTEGEQRWERVNKYLKDLIAEHAANWGVVVNWIRIRDVSLAPHGATIVETDVVSDMPTTVLEHSAPSSRAAPQNSAPLSASPSRAPKGNTKPAEQTTEVVPVPTAQPAQNDPSASQVPDEKVLIKAYNAVKNEEIKDSITIRNIAAQFERIARDPKARDTVSFDAERAAQILYGWAQKNAPSEVDHDDETKPDWVTRRPNDENLMAGG